MTDNEFNHEDDEDEQMPIGDNAGKTERQLGIEVRALMKRQTTLLKKHDANIKAIHDVIIEIGLKLLAGKAIYPHDHIGYNAFVRNQRIDEDPIYGGPNGQQERNAACHIAEKWHAVPEPLDLTDCKRVRPSDILKWCRKRQPGLFPKDRAVRKRGPNKPKTDALIEDEIPDLASPASLLEKNIYAALRLLEGTIETLPDDEIAALILMTEQLLGSLRKRKGGR